MAVLPVDQLTRKITSTSLLEQEGRSLPGSLYLLSRRLSGLEMEIVEHCCFIQPAPIMKRP
jgi:hypothetical protein